jgi:hypothetical protein
MQLHPATTAGLLFGLGLGVLLIQAAPKGSRAPAGYAGLLCSSHPPTRSKPKVLLALHSAASCSSAQRADGRDTGP